MSVGAPLLHSTLPVFSNTKTWLSGRSSWALIVVCCGGSCAGVLNVYASAEAIAASADEALQQCAYERCLRVVGVQRSVFQVLNYAAKRATSQPRYRGAVFKVGSSLLTAVYASLLQADGCLEELTRGSSWSLAALSQQVRSSAQRSRKVPTRRESTCVTQSNTKARFAASGAAARGLITPITTGAPATPGRRGKRERCVQQRSS